jgi:hypothetical protein
MLMRHFGAAIYRVLGPFALTVLLGIAVHCYHRCSPT